MLKKKKFLYILQITYEIVCFIGTLGIVRFIKEGPMGTLPFLIIPFLLVYLSRNAGAQKIAYGLVLSFLAYCTWTVLITFYLTSYLEENHLIGEHSLWDVFAFLIPAVLTIWTLIWSLKRRTTNPKFEIAYLIGLVVILLILTNYR